MNKDIPLFVFLLHGIVHLLDICKKLGKYITLKSPEEDREKEKERKR